jgi:hypothetical protein
MPTHQTVVEHASTVGEGATLLAGLAALYVVSSAARSFWRRTLGRRSDRYGRIARLGTGANLSFFVAVLGEPPAMSSTVVKDDYIEYVRPGDPDWDDGELGGQPRSVPREFLVSTFIDRDYYVQTITDGDNTVLAYSVTTRSRKFQPVLQVPRRPGPLAQRLRWWRTYGRPHRAPAYVKLGRTTFADLDSLEPDSFSSPHFRIMMGAHNHAYSEIVYKGNPGYYQTFVWTASDAARQGRFGSGMAVVQEIEGDEWPNPKKVTEPEWSSMFETQRFRRETVITTYTVIGVSLGPENYPIDRFGPHENLVRTIP